MNLPRCEPGVGLEWSRSKPLYVVEDTSNPMVNNEEALVIGAGAVSGVGVPFLVRKYYDVDETGRIRQFIPNSGHMVHPSALVGIGTGAAGIAVGMFGTNSASAITASAPQRSHTAYLPLQAALLVALTRSRQSLQQPPTPGSLVLLRHLHPQWPSPARRRPPLQHPQHPPPQSRTANRELTKGRWPQATHTHPLKYAILRLSTPGFQTL